MSALPRNANLQDLVAVLRDEQARKLDVCVTPRQIRAEGGNLVVAGVEQELTADGVTTVDGIYRPTGRFDTGIASKLGIPSGFLTRSRDVAWMPDLEGGQGGTTLYDHTVNAMLADPSQADKQYLLRLFRGGPDQDGVGRAFLTNAYQPIDHIDGVMAMLSGIREAGVQVQVDSCDLTDSKVYVRVTCEQLRAMAPTLLANYRSPFGSGGVERAGGWTLEQARAAAGREGQAYEPGTEPVVYAGFEFTNSETGNGNFDLRPRLVVQACRNGLKIDVGTNVFKRQHLGVRLDTGVIHWSPETQKRNLSLISAQAGDAVRAFLSQKFLDQQVAELEKIAGAPVTDAKETIKVVSRKLQYDEATQDELLAFFLRGGQDTSAGVAQAITAYAQTVPDADFASKLEGDAVTAMALAHAMAS